MARRRTRLISFAAALLLLLSSASSRAGVPAGYAGKPFDPAVAGGAGKVPPGVAAGPYVIPGRIDFINYDLGGEGVAYHAGDHITNNGSESVKLALGYRTDAPTATLCLTNQVEKDSWFGTGTPLDGTFFPSATTADYYIGAVRPGDWFNYTVDVQTAGSYALSSAFASGNGPPGGEGGDGSMELEVYVNGVSIADWKATFPDYQTAATFHNWVPYPHVATVTLEAGLQVIQLKSVDAHLNLAYVEFALATDGGAPAADGGAGGADASAHDAAASDDGGAGYGTASDGGPAATPSPGPGSDAPAGSSGSPEAGTGGGGCDVAARGASSGPARGACLVALALLGAGAGARRRRRAR